LALLSTVHRLSRGCRRLEGFAELTISSVKFDGDQLPPILNALTTDNQGNKLVLEVAVCL
jgi:hypothetical protein